MTAMTNGAKTDIKKRGESVKPPLGSSLASPPDASSPLASPPDASPSIKLVTAQPDLIVVSVITFRVFLMGLVLQDLFIPLHRRNPHMLDENLGLQKSCDEGRKRVERKTFSEACREKIHLQCGRIY
jgi:hypothetical protein